MSPTVLNVSASNASCTVAAPFVQLARVSGIVDHIPSTTTPSHLLLIGADRVTWSGGSTRHHVTLLPAATAHRTASRGHARVVVYLDPRRYRLADVSVLAERWATVDPSRVRLHDMFEDALSIPAPRLERRVERAFEALEDDSPIVDAASFVGMSTNWLSRLTMQATGSSPRTWRSYLRMHRAVQALAVGHSTTFAAHAAGFSDAAHLTRTTKRFLGTTPSVLARHRVELHLDAR